MGIMQRHGRCTVCIIKEIEEELSAELTKPYVLGQYKRIRLLKASIRNWTKRIERRRKVSKTFHICSPEHNAYAINLIKEEKTLIEDRIARLQIKIKSAEALVSKQVNKALDYALTFGVDSSEALIEKAKITQYERLLLMRKVTLNRIYKRIGRKEIA